MADPEATKPRRSVLWWVLVTFSCLLALQAGPVIYVVVAEDGMAGFDWGGFIGYSLGSVAVPMVIGCLGLFYRRRAGLAYFVASVLVFLFTSIGNLATT